MLHDAGWAEFYHLVRDETAPPPQKAEPVKFAEQPFGQLTVGVTRYYQAAAVSQRIDLYIEVWRDDSITVRDVCKIGEQFYLIRQVTPTVDADGLLVTRLSLEATDGNVWEVRDGS